MLRRKPIMRIGAAGGEGSIFSSTASFGQTCAFITFLGLIAAIAISALFVGLFYSPPSSSSSSSGGGGVAVDNFTCSNATACLTNGNLTLNSLVVNNLTVVNTTDLVETNNFMLNGSFTCSSSGQISGDCVEGGYISTINTITPFLPSRDFTFIGGPGIAVSGGMHSLTIRNNINITLVGTLFTIRVLFGNITVTLNNQTAHTVLAGPANGTTGMPAFRLLIAEDLPLLDLNSSSSFYGVLPVSHGGTGTSVPLLPGQLFTGDGAGNLIPIYLQPGENVVITNYPNGTIEITTESHIRELALSVPTDIFNATEWYVNTESGNLSFVVLPQLGNQVWASPANGVTGVPAFRSLVEQDLPSISLTTKVYGVLPVALGGTNSSSTLQNGRIMVSNGNAIVEGAALLDGQLFIGMTGSLPVPAVPTGSGGILVIPGPGTLHILMTSAPSFATLNVAGATTLGNYTSCNQPLQPSCLDISLQTCPLGALATTCIPTSGLHLTELTVDFLTIVNQTFNINVDTINGSAFWVENLFADNVVLNNAMTCSGNASISPSCVDISAKECPMGPLGESCFPDTLVLANLQVTANVTVANVYCVGGFIDASCVPDRFKTINGLFANFTSHDFTISPLDSTIVIQADGLYGISIGTTLFTANQSAHAVLIGPLSGTGAPTFRTLDQSDLPPLLPGYIYIGNTTETFNVSLSLPTTLFNEAFQSIGNGGTLVETLATQNAFTVLAGPQSGGSSAPTFRLLNYSDLPPMIMSMDLQVPTAEFAISNNPLVAPGGTLVLTKAPQAGNTFWAGAANGTNGAQPAFRTLVYKDFDSLNLTFGQFLAGANASSTPVPTSILAGSGIIINQTDGTITISASINASNIGTVTSVGLSLPGTVFSVSNSPVTLMGTLTGSFINQAANTVFAGPTTGGALAPTFRNMVLADLPNLHGGQVYIGNPLTNLTSISNLTAGNAISIVTTGSVTTISSTTSVALALPASLFSVSGSPVTNMGTLTGTLIVQAARTFFAAPALSSGIPSFRTMEATDLPTLMSGQIYIGSSGTAVASSLSAGTGITITPGPGTLTVSANFFGTVTSIDFTLPASVFSVTGGPVTSSGTIAASFISQAANTVFAGPNGAPGTPSFRSLVSADIPSLDTSKLTSGVLPIARGGTNSATALNNNRIIVSSSGSLVEAAALTNGQLLIGSTGSAPVASAITGTTNQVNVANGAGTITLSTPQNIHTAATPTFASAFLTALTNQLTLGTTNTVTLSASAPSASRTYTMHDAGANANFVLDTGGPLTITNAATTGQVLRATGTTTASWQTNDNAVFTYQEVSSTVAVTAFSSANFTVITGMTFVLPAGIWQVTFSGTILPSASSGAYPLQLFNGVTAIGHSGRRISGANSFFPVSMQAVVTSDGVNAISAQWRKSGGSGTADMYERSMFALRLV